jgi:hypothetical protein
MRLVLRGVCSTAGGGGEDANLPRAGYAAVGFHRGGIVAVVPAGGVLYFPYPTILSVFRIISSESTNGLF